jgi:ABC-type lipoprotein release transport system permease subunit
VDILLVAWRYLVARPITLVSMASVTVGLAAIVVVDSVMNGFLGQQRAMIRALAPDATVELPTLTVAQSEAVAAEVVASHLAQAVARRIEVPCLHRPKHETPEGIGLPGVGGNFFVQLVGIDPADERKVVDLDQFLRHDRCKRVSGRSEATLQVADLADPFKFDLGDPYWQARVDPESRHRDNLIPVLFGEGLARMCGLSIGSVVTILTPKETGQGERRAARSRDFVMVGTFEAADHHFEVTHALAPRAQVAEFDGLEDGAFMDLVVAAADGMAPEHLRDRLREALAGRVDPERVVAWTDQKGKLLGAVENERRIMNVAMFFVVVVATFSLFMTLHQMVRLKTRDIGVLAAMGAGAGRAGRLFLLCGVLVTLAGAAFGLVAGLTLTHWLNAILGLVKRTTGFELFDSDLFNFKLLPTEPDPRRIAWYVLGSVVCGTLFTLIPSLRAARLDPVEALRHE